MIAECVIDASAALSARRRRPAAGQRGIRHLHTADTSMRLRVLSERKYGYADTCSVSSMHSSTHGYLVPMRLPGTL